MKVFTYGEGARDISVSPLAIMQEIQYSSEQFGEDIRNDSSKQSAGFISAARAQARSFVKRTAELLDRNDTLGAVSEDRQKKIIAAMARGLGYSKVGEGFGLPAFRGDSYLYAGEMVDRSGPVVRLENRRRPASELLPVRSFDPTTQLVQTRGVSPNGSATLWAGNSTVVPQADFDTGSRNQQVYFLVTKTQIDWRTLMYNEKSSLDIVAEKADSASNVLFDAMEDLLFHKIALTDMLDFKSLQMPTETSVLDYSNGTVSMDEAFADFVSMFLRLDARNDERGGLGKTVLIGTDLLRAVLPLNNFAGGGSISGLDLFAAASQQDAAVGSLFKMLGIQRIIRTPKLNSWGGDPTLSAAVVLDLDVGQNGVRQLLGMAPAPIRSASNLTHDEQLWGCAVGGLENASIAGTGVVVAKVA